MRRHERGGAARGRHGAHVHRAPGGRGAGAGASGAIAGGGGGGERPASAGLAGGRALRRRARRCCSTRRRRWSWWARRRTFGGREAGGAGHRLGAGGAQAGGARPRSHAVSGAPRRRKGLLAESSRASAGSWPRGRTHGLRTPGHRLATSRPALRSSASRAWAVNVIAEVKRKSPSGGAFPASGPRPGGSGLRGCGARAPSAVLTDEVDFGGSSRTWQVRAAVSLPVLRKDFLVAPLAGGGERGDGSRRGAAHRGCAGGRELREMVAAAKACHWRRWWRPTRWRDAERALAAGARWWASTTGISHAAHGHGHGAEGRCLGCASGRRAPVAESGLKRRRTSRRLAPRAETRCWWASPSCRDAEPGRALRTAAGREDGAVSVR